MSRNVAVSGWVHGLLAAVIFGLGVGVAIATVALHGYWWGLLLGVITTLATVIALPAGWWSRLAFVLGWVAVLLFATPERSEGDLLVAADTRGYLLLGAGIVVFGAGFVGLVPRRGAPRNSEEVANPPYTDARDHLGERPQT